MVTLLGVSVGVLTHLKHVPEEPSTRLSPDLKDGIIALYSNAVLMSTTPVPEHVLTALQDFISIFFLRTIWSSLYFHLSKEHCYELQRTGSLVRRLFAIDDQWNETTFLKL
jgi:hypothetical protein